MPRVVSISDGPAVRLIAALGSPCSLRASWSEDPSAMCLSVPFAAHRSHLLPVLQRFTILLCSGENQVEARVLGSPMVRESGFELLLVAEKTGVVDHVCFLYRPSNWSMPGLHKAPVTSVSSLSARRR